MTKDKLDLALLGFGIAAVLAATFWPDDPGGLFPEGEDALRDSAIALCQLYLPCTRGDAHYREICKDFGGVGTTCGYLPSWLLYRLGCRDARVVNRIEPGLHDASPNETIGQNIARLVLGGRAIHAFQILRDRSPKRGDVVYFGAVSPSGGVTKEHVAILESYPEGGTGTLVTWDTGHSIQPEGSRSERPIQNGLVSFLGASRTLIGSLDLASVPLSAPADLTDHTALVG